MRMTRTRSAGSRLRSRTGTWRRPRRRADLGLPLEECLLPGLGPELVALFFDLHEVRMEFRATRVADLERLHFLRKILQVADT